MRFVFISERNRQRYLRVMEPVGRFLARLGIGPNTVTVAGLLLSLLAGLIYSMGAFFWGAVVLILAGACDTLDGHLARRGNNESRFGAFLDSTLDRYGEIAVFVGLAWHFSGGASPWSAAAGPPEASPWAVCFVILALSGSVMVSYTRARAEALGAQCREGWMQRPERIVLLVIGSLLGALPLVGKFLITCTLGVLAALANITAFQRIAHVRSGLRERAKEV